MKIYLYENDLPDNLVFESTIAVDTEAMGLQNYRDRLCVVQIGDGKGNCHLVHLKQLDPALSPNLIRLLSDQNIIKIFHFARFDVRILFHTFKVMTKNIYCTKIASRIVRTYTDRHGLKDLCREFLNIELSKYEQSSDWGSATLTPEQQRYAAQDVLHLHLLKEKLDGMLIREKRQDIAQTCFDFLSTRVQLDLWGMENGDIFSYALS